MGQPEYEKRVGQGCTLFEASYLMYVCRVGQNHVY